ncbi:AAA family ATPase [Streptomyces sp. JJ36]|uniref:AAA family ATPase n=1 Tax=Streptomyces sp. JJ36 TaxID=2736645 RepID=UPI001F02776E|nr:ATP-binding protein [Streptomyces sp. JJ36]
MKISEIRGFFGNRTVDLDFERPDGGYAGWTVIAGRNGAGKTSLLRAIALTLAGSAVSQTLAPEYTTWRSSTQAAGVIKADFYLDAEESSSVIVSSESPAPGIHAGVQVKLPIRRESKLKSGVRGTITSEWMEVVVPRDEDDEGKPTAVTDILFAAGYGAFRRLSREVSDSRHDSDVLERASRFSTLFNEDSSLTEGVAWLVGLYLRGLEGETEAESVLETVLNLMGDGLLPDGFTVDRVNSGGLWVSRGGRSFPLREMSDGYRTVSALVLDLVRHLFAHYGNLNVAHRENGISIDQPGVVLIDEIDAHLHVSWQMRVGEWLKEHFPSIQFIVTTHSPYICQAADPAGLIRLPGPDEEAPVEIVDAEMYQRIVYGSGDDAALSSLFGIDSPYSKRAEKARRDLVDLEEKVLSGEATELEVARYEDLSRRLSSSLSARVDEVAARLGSCDD